ncbi:MAG TPA: hypothetical protein VFV36_05385 [Candidatus Methylomirabilis sp.]|nr:hypothetical protein [Candidatus Methylomirabilis sp.]
MPRSHVNKHGEPKPAKTREEAVGLALRYSYEVATGQSFGRGEVQAYECDYCGAWHVGVIPLWQRRRIQRAGVDWALWLELGDRAWWNLVSENRGVEPGRCRAVQGRAYAARDRRESA